MDSIIDKMSNNLNPDNKKFSIIVAIDSINGIGYNNELLCKIPEDLKRFKKLTLGNPIIMGKNTFLSLPNKKPLPERINIVISSNSFFVGCENVNSIEEAIDFAHPTKENFIIGGSSIYEQFLPYIQKLYITKINKEFHSDRFFPQFNIDKEWKLNSVLNQKENHPEKLEYNFYEFERIN